MNIRICAFILFTNILLLPITAYVKNNLNAFFDVLLSDNRQENRYKSLLQTGIHDFSVGLFVGSGGRIDKISNIQRTGNVNVYPGKLETWIEMTFIVKHLDVIWDNSTCFGIRCHLWATMLNNKFDVKMAVRPINCQVSYNINLNTIGTMEVSVSELPRYIPSFFFNGALYIVEVFFKGPLTESVKHRINHGVILDFIDKNQIDQICIAVNETIHSQKV
ncbi:uncharacterized protein LOC112690869 [Sipha flava]|jgi:hypothetical protein|uniref:Uncharacterized protein LOC112690869 n=1 Tax=Sipha flava TaxID=143950 RepID=A0A2S2QKP7_9HEMI|nr:uncharacterized protein LOC112690869 [Sipha flava]